LAFMYALEKWILRKKVKWWALAIGPAYLIVAPLYLIAQSMGAGTDFEDGLKFWKDLLLMHLMIGGLWTASSVWVVLKLKKNIVESQNND
jgi:hypothetical protein